jgi:hypothetical protein
MHALANRPTMPAPEPTAPRPAGRAKDESPNTRPSPVDGTADRPSFLRALLRALGTLHT